MIEAAPTPTAARAGEEIGRAMANSIDLTSMDIGGDAGGGGAVGKRLIACGGDGA